MAGMKEIVLVRNEEQDAERRRRLKGIRAHVVELPDGFVGVWKPRDRNGKSLGKTFNVFAAPEDLPGIMKYVDVIEYMAKLENWHGYSGTDYPTDKEIFAALKDGSYNGGWIIPPCELLTGIRPDHKLDLSKVSQPDNLFTHQNQSALKGAFKIATAMSGSDRPGWYWSSTKGHMNAEAVWYGQFSDRFTGWVNRDGLLLSCRPVRLVEAKRF